MATYIQKIIKHAGDPTFFEEVFAFAKTHYQDAKRTTGESYLEHTANVAWKLSQMGLDKKTIAAGILHDVANLGISPSRDITLKELEKKFGKDIARLVEGTSSLNKIYYSFNVGAKEEVFLDRDKAENLRKMFLAIAQDLRVVLIELAARIDGLEKIGALPKEAQKLYAVETLQIFVPIAHRLGLGEIKTTLEDLAFAHLNVEKFQWLKENIKQKYEERQKYLKRFIPHLKKIFKEEHVKFLDITYRAKSYWSTYQKLVKKGMDFERVHDLVALRLIVPDIAACYKALGIIHKYFKPISEEINDYIAKPKGNGYKSLHTTVFLEGSIISEIQIKTDEMQREAEYGVCAHWSYKERVDLNKEGPKFAWTKDVPEFWKTFKIDFFSNTIFVFTPKGDIISLPKGSTAVDFAYAVHSDIGNHCESAKIDGKIIPLSQPLRNGDIVEITTNIKRRPSQDWLRFVKTNFAKSHIKKLIAEKVSSSIFSIPVYIGKKIYETAQIATKSVLQPFQAKKTGGRQLYLAGQKGMLVHMAKCCNPNAGDIAKAYLTKHRAAVLHKVSCKNMQKLAQKFPEKIIDASWK